MVYLFSINTNAFIFLCNIKFLLSNFSTNQYIFQGFILQNLISKSIQNLGVFHYSTETFRSS